MGVAVGSRSISFARRMHGQSANKVCKVNSCLVHQRGHKVSSEDDKVNEWTCGEFANGETLLFPMEKKPF
ncbi:hypothetical protein D5086_003162 [Populus alba]|uniref:Uncharacterized protein n=1 Tax=Populus alba TaxID=43335 RepID=A0ACC4D3R1_POPAL